MIAALVRKDMLLLVRNKFMTTVLMLLFLLVIIGINMGVMAYYMVLLGGIWQFLMVTSTVEKKSGAAALLATTPYTCARVVSGRYMSALLLYALLTLAYCAVSLVSLVFPDVLPPLTPHSAAGGFLAAALFIAITLPLYMKFSELTLRLISLSLILGGGSVLWVVREALQAFVSVLSTSLFVGICLGGGVVSLLISRAVAVALMKKAEY